MFRYCEVKQVDGESCCPSPSLSWVFWILQVFSHTEGFPFKVFWYRETKQFWQNIVIPAPSLIPDLFRYQKFSETQKGSSTNYFEFLYRISWKLFSPFASLFLEFILLIVIVTVSVSIFFVFFWFFTYLVIFLSVLYKSFWKLFLSICFAVSWFVNENQS